MDDMTIDPAEDPRVLLKVLARYRKRAEEEIQKWQSRLEGCKVIEQSILEETTQQQHTSTLSPPFMGRLPGMPRPPKPGSVRQKILEKLKETNREMSVQELRAAFAKAGWQLERSTLTSRLSAMVVSGEVVRPGPDRYALPRTLEG